MKTQTMALLIIIAAAFLGFAASAYVVDETEMVVVTQFNRVVGEPITKPGLNFRIPFIQRPNYFLKNIQEWDGEPGQIPTLDKTYIWVDSFARWRITDPIAFFETVTDRETAMKRLDDIINPAVRNAVTSHHLIETVRNTNRQMSSLEQVDTGETEALDPNAVTSHHLIETVRNSNRQMTSLEQVDTGETEALDPNAYRIKTGREKLSREILKASQPKLTKFGIDLIDVKIKRVNYIQKVQESVYGRMIAERNQMAEGIRSEGRGEAFRIEGDKEKDLRGIQSTAYRTAQEIKGKADAEATKIYAEAYNQDPEYYSFTKALEVYKTAFSQKSRVVLSTDSEFLGYLKDFSVPPGE